MDFFNPVCATSCGQEREFWIYDNAGPQKPAYVQYELLEDWNAHVRNDNGCQIEFRAIDNCMDLLGEGGLELTRCDCMLEYSENQHERTYHFIELKQRKKANWQKIGFAQLRQTIQLFKAHNPAVNASSIKAQLCNPMRPMLCRTRAEQQKRFKDELGLRAENVLLNPTIVI